MKRGRSLFHRAALLLALAVAVHAAPLVESVHSIGITVSDLDKSVDFYTRVLGFESVSTPQETHGDALEHLTGVFGARVRLARLKLGAEQIDLTEYLAPRGRTFPADSRGNDLWFQHIAIVVSDMDRAYGHLRRHKVTHASTGPQRLPDWNPNAGGIRAFYFRDPDGHYLELIWFPAGKGDQRWQQRESAADRMFLGIDHTAIAVSDTDASLRFYRDLLGMHVAGNSENYGVEQERLNNVFGARLRITALRAAGGGPGIELLEYLAPRTGRPLPNDATANDLTHWQTRLIAAQSAGGVSQAWNALVQAKNKLVSNGAVQVDGSPLGFRIGLLARDPDGHALLFAE